MTYQDLKANLLPILLIVAAILGIASAIMGKI